MKTTPLRLRRGRKQQNWNMYVSSEGWLLCLLHHCSAFPRNPNTRYSAQVKQHGIAVFLMPSGMLGTLLSLIDVIPLFSNTGWGQNANLAFLKKHMGTSFQKRSQPWSANIRKEDVHSGDFLALSKIRGRWGGFQTLEKWVTGAFAGHTAVFLKDENGTLWVAESGYENKKVYL